MTAIPPVAGGSGLPPEQPSAPPRADTPSDLRAAGITVASLAVLGALLGLLWARWSPPGPLAIIYPGGAILPDENEDFVAADGRFLVIAVVTGLLAGLIAWRLVRHRGAIMALALAVGSILGSLLMWWVGHLTGGGDATGAARMLTDGTPVHVTQRLPLGLQAHGFLFAEAAVAVLVYAVLVAFAASDDLGRPDPVRERLTAVPVAVGGPPLWPGSVHPGDQSQGGWGYGDAPRAPQQGDLPPQ